MLTFTDLELVNLVILQLSILGQKIVLLCFCPFPNYRTCAFNIETEKSHIVHNILSQIIIIWSSLKADLTWLYKTLTMLTCTKRQSCCAWALLMVLRAKIDEKHEYCWWCCLQLAKCQKYICQMMYMFSNLVPWLMTFIQGQEIKMSFCLPFSLWKKGHYIIHVYCRCMHDAHTHNKCPLNSLEIVKLVILLLSTLRQKNVLLCCCPFPNYRNCALNIETKKSHIVHSQHSQSNYHNTVLSQSCSHLTL